MSTNDNEIAKAGFIAAMNGKFENKNANKKDDVSGDFSEDNTSYPTVRAMKAEDALKVNISDVKDNLTSNDSDKPLSAKQGKALQDTKVDKITGKGLSTEDFTTAEKTKLAGLATVAETGSYNDLTNKPTLTSLGGGVTVEKQSPPDTGFASTYVIKQNGVQVGSKINILKDKMVRSISVETVGATPNSLESANNLVTGNKYILMVVNTEDNDGATSLILPIDDWVDLQTGDNTSIVISNAGVISVKPGYVESIINDYLTALTNAL